MELTPNIHIYIYIHHQEIVRLADITEFKMITDVKDVILEYTPTLLQTLYWNTPNLRLFEAYPDLQVQKPLPEQYN